MCDIPLTTEQRIFAEEHHDLIYKFLNTYFLPQDEFYDIVVFGYLSAVCNYLTDISLQSSFFTTICWKAMLNSLDGYFKEQHAQKRRSETISFHSVSPNHTGSHTEAGIASNGLMLELETKLLLHDLAKRISKQQMDIVRLKCHGYSNQDIAHKQNISKKRVQTLLKGVRKELSKICSE